VARVLDVLGSRGAPAIWAYRGFRPRLALGRADTPVDYPGGPSHKSTVRGAAFARSRP
jgi:hypothetical protein